MQTSFFILTGSKAVRSLSDKLPISVNIITKERPKVGSFLDADLISSVLGTVYLSHNRHFRRPLGMDDILTTTLTIQKKHADEDDIVVTAAL